MTEVYKLVHIEKPEESAWGIIGRGLATFNKEQAGDNQFERLCYAIQTPGEEIVGGILGEVYWGWLYIDLLWVKEELCGQGYGYQVFGELEDFPVGHQRCFFRKEI